MSGGCVRARVDDATSSHLSIRSRRLAGLASAVLLSASAAATALSAQHIEIDTVPRAGVAISARGSSASAQGPGRDSTSTLGPTGRIVVGEYLYGVFCGSCQLHEMAFDTLFARYPATQFIGLAYQGTVTGLPLSDPTDSISERLFAWYGYADIRVHGLFPSEPAFDNWIDGHATAHGDDEQFAAEAVAHQVQAMTRAIEAELHRAPEAVLHVQARPRQGTLVTQVVVDSLAPGHADVYVRIFVVEDTVHLVAATRDSAGRHPVVPMVSGRLTHYMVVRAVARDATHSLGIPLHGPGTVAYTFDLAAIQHKLLQARHIGISGQDSFGNDDAARWMRDEYRHAAALFQSEQNWRINPTRLHVVAVVQDAKAGDVLQAAMINVPGRQLVLP